MARSRLNSASKDLIKDDGAVLISVVDGEQLRVNITLNWIVNLSEYTVFAKVVESDMTGEVDENGYPLDVRVGGVVSVLSLIDSNETDNSFDIVIPENLISDWTTLPTPDNPSYGWIELEVRDSGVNEYQQVWKPVRGLIEVLYSPSEA